VSSACWSSGLSAGWKCASSALPRTPVTGATRWLDGIELWHRANGVVPQKVIVGTIVHIRDGDDAHAARFGGWANLAEVPDPLRAGVHDGRGAVAAAQRSSV